MLAPHLLLHQLEQKRSTIFLQVWRLKPILAAMFPALVDQPLPYRRTFLWALKDGIDGAFSWEKLPAIGGCDIAQFCDCLRHFSTKVIVDQLLAEHRKGRPAADTRG